MFTETDPKKTLNRKSQLQLLSEHCVGQVGGASLFVDSFAKDRGLLSRMENSRATLKTVVYGTGGAPSHKYFQLVFFSSCT